METVASKVLLTKKMILFEVGCDIFMLNREVEERNTSLLFSMTDLRSIQDSFPWEIVMMHSSAALPKNIIDALSDGCKTLDTIDNYLIEQLVMEIYDKKTIRRRSALLYPGNPF
jgi:hypothetical protein